MTKLILKSSENSQGDAMQTSGTFRSQNQILKNPP
jgi:hypothetical protein